MTAGRHIQLLKAVYPFLKTPIIVSAPMRVFAGAELAVATFRGGGMGFIGPGVRSSNLVTKLERAKELLKAPSFAQSPSTQTEPSHLPIGVGFQLFDGVLEDTIAYVQKYRPIAVWLFAPANGQQDIDQWASSIRDASSGTQIWLQVGSVMDAVQAAKSHHAPDVLVLQGSDAGGHGLKKGAGIITLLPEVADRLHEIGKTIPLIGAGGIADGRGVAAVLATGVAAGAVMGTRFLASTEADIRTEHQENVLRVADGGQNTVRTTLFDRLQGRNNWPDMYDGRAIVNASVHDEEDGLDFQLNKQKYETLTQSGSNGWGDDGRLAAYAGTAVGLVKKVTSAQEIVKNARSEAVAALQEAVAGLTFTDGR